MHSKLNSDVPFFLNQIGGISTIVSVFVQYVARDLMQVHVGPLCVGFTYTVGLQKCT